MKVYATIKHHVEIDPISVIDKLFDEATLGYNTFLEECDGRYYKCLPLSHYTKKDEIDKKEYDYINSLLYIKAYLNETK